MTSGDLLTPEISLVCLDWFSSTVSLGLSHLWFLFHFNRKTYRL